MASIATIIAGMQREIAELKRRQANFFRSGPVVNVDPSTQSVKIDVGDEGSPLVTPWIRWPERAGARKTWNPPSIGEDMTVLSPSGEITGRSRAFPGGFTDGNGAPSGDGEATVYTQGPVTVTTTSSGVNLTVGGVVVEVTAAGIAFSGGEIRHNGKDIGDTHKHGGVVGGDADTDVPI